MKGNDDAVVDFILWLLASPIWVTAGLVLLVGGLLMWLLTAAGRYVLYGPPSKRELRRIYRQRNDAIADVVEIRREAEQRMRQIAREESDVIDGMVVEE
jgi:hypothetical protein